MPSATKPAIYITALALCIPLNAVSQEAPIATETATENTVQSTSHLTFGTRLGEDTVEAFTDLIFPLLSNDDNIIFLNPRLSLKDEGENEGNFGIGYRRKFTDWVVGGANIYFDTRESAHNNRFNQWGAGVELLSKYVDFRSNYYDADNSKERIGSATSTSVQKTSRTTATARNEYSDPYAEGNSIFWDVDSVVTTRTTTTTTTTSRLFEQFEAGMDGWDAEIGGKIPIDMGPEVRLYAGYYDYDNPVGTDISGVKGRIEIKTGAYFALDAEVFEDEELNGSNYFVGFRLQVPLTRDLTWQKFRQGLFSMRQRNLDERMRSEMVMRDVRIQTKETDWEENVAKQQTSVEKSVSTKVLKPTTTKVKAADNITFVDGDTTKSENGSNETPYASIQEGVDNAGENKTIFVYETGGTATGKTGPTDGGGSYDEQVVLKEGQVLTSKISWDGGSYATENLPVIKPTEVRVTNERFDSSEVNSTASVVTMAQNSTVQRMDLDATATEFVTYDGFDFHYDPVIDFFRRQTSAIYSEITNQQNASLNIEGNEMITSGRYSSGVNIEGDDSINSSVIVTGNKIITNGDRARGIYISAEDSSNVTVTASGNNITASGDTAEGIYISAGDSSNVTVTASDNKITASGYRTGGIYFGSYWSINSLITASGNSITTSGTSGDGIDIDIGGSLNSSGTASDNSISTSGLFSTGIDISLENATDGSVTASNNNITTNGERAHGNLIWVENSINSSVTASDNSITISGDDSVGILINGPDSTDSLMTVSGNTINTTGQESDAIGISTRATLGSTDVSVLANTITTNGDEAAGLGFYADNAFSINNNISSNTFTLKGSDSWGIDVRLDDSNSFDKTTLEENNIFNLEGAGSDKVRITL